MIKLAHQETASPTNNENEDTKNKKTPFNDETLTMVEMKKKRFAYYWSLKRELFKFIIINKV